MSNEEKNIKLFSEFPPVSREQWEEIITRDLKGADRERKLVWHTLDGLRVEPYYMREDLDHISHLGSLPGRYPYVRGNKTSDNDWEIRQEMEEKEPEKANSEALDAIERGAQGIVFDVRDITNSGQMQTLLKDINPEKHAIHLVRSTNYKVTIDLLLDALKQKGTDTKKAKGSLDFDPIGYYVLQGQFYNSWKDNINELSSLMDKMADELPQFRIINVNARFFHNAGATIVQELGYSLAAANEYLAALTYNSKKPGNITPYMQFSFAIGSSYFMEIAKFRAARKLWAKITEQYDANPELGKAFIHAETSGWNKTIYDPYVNMIRNTTESMSGAIAGCDSMVVKPFDRYFRSPDEMSKCISRNVQIILKEESHFNKTIDAAAGSYYIENLTQSIADAAWKLFLETEQAGGFIKTFEAGTVKTKIEESCRKREESIAKRKTNFVGVNQYPKADEFMLNEIQRELLFKENKEDGKALIPYRGAEPFEALRLATEKHVKSGNKKPSVYLLKIGNRAMRTARATFTSAFFGCAGYNIHDNLGFDDAEEGVKDALNSGAEIIVICSSDEDYPQYVPQIAKEIKAKDTGKTFVVAGDPKEHKEEFQNAGVDDFVHVKTNVLESLKKYQKQLGVMK